MAYTNGQTTAQTLAAIQSATPTAPTDAVLNALSGLANASGPTPVGTPVLLWNVLVKCTTGVGTTQQVPVFSYDATPS